MSARRDVASIAYAMLANHGAAEAADVADLIAAVAVAEAFTTDEDTRNAAARALGELSGRRKGQPIARAIVAARECAGQCAARAAHGRGRR